MENLLSHLSPLTVFAIIEDLYTHTITDETNALLIVAWECLQTNTGRKYAEELCRQNSIDPEELDSIELEDEE